MPPRSRPNPLNALQEEHRAQMQKGLDDLAKIRRSIDRFSAFMNAHQFRSKPTYRFWLQQTAILDEKEEEMQTRWFERYPAWQTAVNRASGKALDYDLDINFFSGRMTQEKYDAEIKKMMGNNEDGTPYQLPGVAIDRARNDDSFIDLMYHTDWDMMSRAEKYRLTELFKKQHVDFFSNRVKMYHGLLENNVGSIYGMINNVNAYQRMVSAPIEPGTESKTTEDYYYNTLVPTSAAIIWWFDGASENLGAIAKTTWMTRIRIPNVANDASLFTRDLKDKAGALVSDNKYFVAGFLIMLAAIPAIISHM